MFTDDKYINYYIYISHEIYKRRLFGKPSKNNRPAPILTQKNIGYTDADVINMQNIAKQMLRGQTPHTLEEIYEMDEYDRCYTLRISIEFPGEVEDLIQAPRREWEDACLAYENIHIWEITDEYAYEDDINFSEIAKTLSKKYPDIIFSIDGHYYENGDPNIDCSEREALYFNGKFV